MVEQTEWASGFPCAQHRHQLFLPGTATCLFLSDNFFQVLKTDLHEGLIEGSCVAFATSKNETHSAAFLNF